MKTYNCDRCIMFLQEVLINDKNKQNKIEYVIDTLKAEKDKNALRSAGCKLKGRTIKNGKD